MKFKYWLYLAEGINYNNLSKMWKKFFPQETDTQIKEKIDIIANSDPTPNKEYINWLTREVLNKRLRLPEDQGVLQPDIIFFHDLKKRNQLKRFGVDANIEKYTRYQFQELVDGLREKITPSKRQELKDIKAEGAKKIYQDNVWMVIESTTEEACIAYGKGTKWCTAATNDNAASHYLKDGPIYVIWKDKKPFAQLHTSSSQLMDTADKPLKTIPDDLKDILFKVIPKNNTKDHAFLYKVTGKLEPEMQKQLEQNTVVKKSDNWTLTKTNSEIGIAVLTNGIDNEDFNNIRNFKEFYSLSNGQQTWFWKLNTSGNNWTTTGWGKIWVPYPSKSEVHYSVFNLNERFGYDDFFDKNEAKIINNLVDPQSIEEALGIYYITQLTNPKSNKILTDYVNSWTIKDISEYKTQSGDPIFLTMSYFTNTHDPKLYDIFKHKLEQLEQEINNTSGLDEVPETFRKHIQKSLSHTSQKLNGLREMIAKQATPDKMNDLVEMAKRGNYFTLYEFWRKTISNWTKDQNDLAMHGNYHIQIAPPWDKNGWLEAEPYLAPMLINAFYNHQSEYLNNYYLMTSNPTETKQRMEGLIKKAIRDKRQQEEG